VFIGVKMLLYDVVHMPVWVSLVVIGAVAGGAIAASLWRDRRLARRREERFAEERLGEERLGEHGGRQPAAEPRRPVRT
jgi:hypothetical protein